MNSQLDAVILGLLHQHPQKTSTLRKAVGIDRDRISTVLGEAQKMGLVVMDRNRQWSLHPKWWERLPVCRPTHLENDADQLAVVLLPPNARAVVTAPPGHGKTRTLQKRVAALLERGMSPRSILVVSFTRVAVREIRQRVKQLEGAHDAAAHVRMTTIDSLAGRIVNLHHPNPAFRGFDETLVLAISLLSGQTESDSLDGDLGQVRHILLDEAQDLTGRKLEFASRLLAYLSLLGSGWTVFSDPCQAIYGWERDAPADELDTLSSLTGHFDFSIHQLRSNYRTQDPMLLFASRALRLSCASPVGSATAGDFAMLLGDAPPASRSLAEIAKSALEAAGSIFVLCRRRAGAFQAGYRLGTAGISFELQLGGTPPSAPSWVALVLNAMMDTEDETEFDQGMFSAAFGSVTITHADHLAGVDEQAAWEGLARLDGRFDRSELAIGRIADAILRGRGAEELPTGRTAAVIVGTIHGVKGREADSVILSLPRKPKKVQRQKPVEERTIYVGVTRARTQLLVRRQDWNEGGGTIETRAYAVGPSKGLLVEFGRDGDLSTAGSGLEMEAAQSWLASQGPSDLLKVDVSFADALVTAGREKTMIAKLSPEGIGQVERAVQALGGRAWTATTTQMRGSVTVAVSEKESLGLPDPWGSSRLVLAPQIQSLVFAGDKK